MPSITVKRRVTLDDVVKGLQQELGDQFKVSPSRNGDHEKIRVSHALEMATVRLVPKGEATTFKVHGGGFIINRIVNQLVLSRRVCKALGDSVGAPSPTETWPTDSE
jgi:hypothetical protein